MTEATAPAWEAKRTDETRAIECALKEAGLQEVDAYRYNAASIRVRVIDERFEGMAYAKRDAMVEPHLEKLPERTQADIMNLFTFAPSELALSEIEQRPKNIRDFMMNAEFEHPSPSML